jgi:histidine ammonia-lyase
VLAVEILTGCRALDFRAPLEPGPATGAVLAAVREVVEGPGPDRHLAPEIAAVVDAVADGRLVRAAERHTGPLA